jgi:sugar phosphate isomerase/epimerase
MKSYSRREFGKLAVVGAPAAALLLQSTPVFGATPVKPNSKWAGVQVGMNVPYSLGTRTAMNGEEVLARCVALGVSAVELRAQPIESSMGLPASIVLGPAPSDYAGAMARAGEIPGVPTTTTSAAPGAPPPSVGTAGGRAPRTPEQIAAYRAAAAELRKWRLTAPLAKAKELRAKYEEAGVVIDIVKFDGIGDIEGDELDYAFTLAKALGARAVSGELVMPAVKRLGEAADRHQLFIAHHAHLAGSPAIYEEAFRHGKFAGANLDIGHFIAGNYGSPLAFMKKHHERITHIHVKDRKLNAGPNVEFGQGDTPVKEVLQAIRDHGWRIMAAIEFEIPLPAGIDRTPEILKAMQYCKECLLEKK